MIPSDKFGKQPINWPKFWQIASIIGGVLLVVIIVAGERNKPSNPSYSASYDTGTYRAAAEELVRQRLRDPSSAEFSDVVVRPSTPGHAATVCGRVNARNGFGGMNGAQRFIAGDDVSLEDEVGAAAMNGLWARSC